MVPFGAVFADLQVNWVWSPVSGAASVKVFEGDGTGDTQISTANANSSPLRHTVDSSKITGGTYTIQFKNKSAVPITSAAFSATGEANKTWVRVTAFKDYLITSTAGGTTLTVFARQGPGPNQASSSVLVSTWHGPT